MLHYTVTSIFLHKGGKISGKYKLPVHTRMTSLGCRSQLGISIQHITQTQDDFGVTHKLSFWYAVCERHQVLAVMVCFPVHRLCPQ